MWPDNWTGDEPLCMKFPDLLTLVLHPNATIAHSRMWSSLRFEIHKKPIWLRSGRSCSAIKHHGVAEHTVGQRRLCSGEQTKRVFFSIKSCYKLLCKERWIVVHGPWSMIWKSKAPSRASFFQWVTTNKACLTLEIYKNGCKLVSLPNRCFLCCSNRESPAHLLLHWVC